MVKLLVCSSRAVVLRRSLELVPMEGMVHRHVHVVSAVACGLHIKFGGAFCEWLHLLGFYWWGISSNMQWFPFGVEYHYLDLRPFFLPDYASHAHR